MVQMKRNDVAAVEVFETRRIVADTDELLQMYRVWLQTTALHNKVFPALVRVSRSSSMTDIFLSSYSIVVTSSV